jgi:hypothetical protein
VNRKPSDLKKSKLNNLILLNKGFERERERVRC